MGLVYFYSQWHGRRMDLISPVATAIAYFMIIVAIGVVLLFFVCWLARVSTGFFKSGS